MIYFYNFYEWQPFEITYNDRYDVSGEFQAMPDLINGNPLIHDLMIERIYDKIENLYLTDEVFYDTVWQLLERNLI